MTILDAETVVFTRQALDTVINIQNRIHDLRAHFGDATADRVGASFGQAFARLIALGGTISADGDLGLMSQNHIVVGMVFFREDLDKTITASGRDPGLYADWLRAELPEAGEWSLHS